MAKHITQRYESTKHESISEQLGINTATQRNRQNLITFRVSDTEKSAIYSNAKDSGKSVSALVRSLCCARGSETKPSLIERILKCVR